MTATDWNDWFPDQRCAGCGEEHPGEACPTQADLFSEEEK